MVQSLRRRSRSNSLQPHTWSQRNERGIFLLLEASSLNSGFLGFGVQCLLLGFCSSLLLSSPLGVQWVQPACPYPDVPIRKPSAESGVWQVIHSAVVLDTCIIPPETFGWPSGPPTYIIPLAEEDREAERDVQAAHRRQCEQKQTGTLSPPSTASSPGQAGQEFCPSFLVEGV